MGNVFIPVVVALLASACGPQAAPPTQESQADNAAVSAPNGVGAQKGAKPPAAASEGPPASAVNDQSGAPGQTATSQGGGDQQGLSGSSPQ